MVGLTVAIILFLLLLVWVFATYNRFIGLLNLVSEAWSDIDVQLKRRADLIPNLVSVVTGYAKHEQTTLEAVARLRAGQSYSANTAERSESENALTQGIKKHLCHCRSLPGSEGQRAISLDCNTPLLTLKTRFSMRGATTTAPCGITIRW